MTVNNVQIDSTYLAMAKINRVLPITLPMGYQMAYARHVIAKRRRFDYSFGPTYFRSFRELQK